MRRKSTKLSAKKTKSLAEGWQEKSVIISNDDGIHTRPAAAFVRVAQKFPGPVRVRKGELEVDGKSILNILSLGAKKGTRLVLTAEGPKAKEALQALGRLIQEGFEE